MAGSAGPKRAGNGTVAMQPTIDSGVVQGAAPAGRQHRAPSQASRWLYARIAVEAEHVVA